MHLRKRALDPRFRGDDVWNGSRILPRHLSQDRHSRMMGGVLKAYEAAIHAGRVDDDPGQRDIAARLDDLAGRLAGYAPAGRGNMLSRLLRRGTDARRAPRGIYLWGRPGRGKTMLMDMFYHAVPVKKKRRVHFIAFMRDVHRRIHDIREKQARGRVWDDADPIEEVAGILANRAWLLCLDEFQVSDITDAMILSRLFGALFRRGVVLAATSNTPPEKLYENGLNRAVFLPFIRLLEERTDILALDGGTDYRQCGEAGDPVWVAPLGAEADAAMERMWLSATGGAAGMPVPLDLGGRVLMVPRAHGRAARFSCAGLCGQPLGAADYLVIAERFDVVFLDNIPIFGADERNEVLRFVTLIDALYDRRARLVASAAAGPEGLYPQGPLRPVFARAASRLEEMRGRNWPND